MNTHEKKRHDGIAHLSGRDNQNLEVRPKRGRTYASSNMQDNKFVYWNAFTTMKLPSTSHAARIKSKDGQTSQIERRFHSHFQPSRYSILPHPEKPSGIGRRG